MAVQTWNVLVLQISFSSRCAMPETVKLTACNGGGTGGIVVNSPPPPISPKDGPLIGENSMRKSQGVA